MQAKYYYGNISLGYFRIAGRALSGIGIVQARLQNRCLIPFLFPVVSFVLISLL